MGIALTMEEKKRLRRIQEEETRLEFVPQEECEPQPSSFSFELYARTTSGQIMVASFQPSRESILKLLKDSLEDVADRDATGDISNSPTWSHGLGITLQLPEDSGRNLRCMPGRETFLGSVLECIERELEKEDTEESAWSESEDDDG